MQPPAEIRSLYYSLPNPAPQESTVVADGLTIVRSVSAYTRLLTEAKDPEAPEAEVALAVETLGVATYCLDRAITMAAFRVGPSLGKLADDHAFFRARISQAGSSDREVWEEEYRSLEASLRGYASFVPELPYTPQESRVVICALALAYGSTRGRYREQTQEAIRQTALRFIDRQPAL